MLRIIFNIIQLICCAYILVNFARLAVKKHGIMPAIEEIRRRLFTDTEDESRYAPRERELEDLRTKLNECESLLNRLDETSDKEIYSRRKEQFFAAMKNYDKAMDAYKAKWE